ncbi:fruit protein [Musa troglodytarum]|uniref:Fruit protein n=1 Tax=Musa troglodytarum TaxID=320322 RepID=A0A9E7L9P6_9LILI|nr:fruit protein [Musa troglodytarum]
MATTLAASCPSPPLLRPMSLLPRLRLGLSLPLRRRALTAVAAAVRQDAATWTQAPLSLVAPASADASLFHVSVDVSDAPDLAVSYTLPGQYLQLRVPASEKPSFLAIASPPSFASSRGEFQFLVKRVPGSTADLLCELGRGDVVELSAVMGKGFQVERISPPDAFPAVLIFSTGSGISPIRSLIESGFNANERSDVRLYYGARNLQRMAYQDRFKDWESTGVRVIPVLSQPDEKWSGERGYVQTAFSRTKEILNPLLTGAVLCGHKQMAEVIGSDGEFEEYVHSVRAAELMVENPGEFVCDAHHLSVGCRIPGLVADEELERRRLYFLLPLDLLFSVLTEDEMAALSCRASTATKKRGVAKNFGRRILPVLSDFCLFPAEAKRVSETTGSVKRMSTQRSWKPALDTIEEVP